MAIVIVLVTVIHTIIYSLVPFPSVRKGLQTRSQNRANQIAYPSLKFVKDIETNSGLSIPFIAPVFHARAMFKGTTECEKIY